MLNKSKKSYEFRSIGYCLAQQSERYALPRQAQLGLENSAVIELDSGQNFEQALQDLDGFSHIWIVYAFHANCTWKPCVMPPRGGKKRGVFATRSPHRPSGIGMSCVRLLSIDGRRLLIGNHDLLDGTPILDIKPYLVYADSFPAAKQGWLDELEAEPLYSIVWSPPAVEQRDFLLREGDLSIENAVRERLRRHPFPYPNARVRELEDGTFELAYKTWRLRYSVDRESVSVTISEIYSGYSPEGLGAGEDLWGDLDLHRSFKHSYTV